MRRSASDAAATPAELRQARALECARLLLAAAADQPEAVAACVMRAAAGAALEHRFGSSAASRVRQQARLFTGPWPLWPDNAAPPLARAFEALAGAFRSELAAHELGCVYETLIGAGRKRSGSFYTPPELAASVVRAALAPRLAPSVQDGRAGSHAFDAALSICDPALGAGVFLLEAAAELARRSSRGSLRRIVEQNLYGADKNALAVAVAEIGLWLFCADPALDAALLREHLLHADALDLDWRARFPDVFARSGGFDVVLGNPPWVAFAGRAAQALPQAERARYARFRAFRGYPTLHALFVERSAELAAHGTVALLLPSPLSDLDGYRAVRTRLTTTHVPREPLMEYGQDAFASVTQPCFALIADAAQNAAGSERPWRLLERQRSSSEARAIDAPEELLQLLQLEPLPAAAFGEMGFQTSRIASETLLLRAAGPDTHHRYPLLEGRDVHEFFEGPPRLFLRAEPELLRAAGCRLRPQQAYERVAFVVRQTASVPIAALHGGLPFRNTLLAGFETDGLSPASMVALLNSTLYRALHLAARRDARQAVFPQVKIRHLRSLPRPPDDSARLTRIAELARRATAHGTSAELRAAVDELVFDLFRLSESVRAQIRHFVSDRVRPARTPREERAPAGNPAQAELAD